MRLARRCLIAIVVGSLVLATACGDDDDDASVQAAGGEPIRVMTFQSLAHPDYAVPQSRTAAEAAIRAINESGGVRGRPLELDFCDTNFDPNTEAGCARQAVEDGAVASVGSASLFPNTIPILERGNVAFIGGLGQSLTELDSEVSFPLAGGLPGWYVGAVAQALQRGITRPAILVTNQIAGAKYAGEIYEGALEQAGVPAVRSIDVPVGVPDQAAAAAQAMDNTDAIFVATLAGDGVKLLKALRQANYSGLVLAASITFGDSLDALGDAGDGLLLPSQVVPITETDNPAISRFIAEMDAIDPGAKKDERAQATWAAYQIFAEVLKRINGEITPDTVLEAMRNLEDPVETGIIAPYRVAGQTSPYPETSRIFNPTVVFTEVRDGRIQQLSDGFVNPFEALDEAAGG